MSTVPPPPAIQLPTEPYPGLRPFLDHEASLLMGRGGQVREVIKRLEETHFVAVVGGSGSGKSSLVRAGVVPRLRGYGIPEAGGYWIPVTCTPGTPPPAVSENHLTAPEPPGETAITRLAWKLSQALRPLGTPAADADRRVEIATVFRQSAGFARLVDAYSDDLPRRGPDGKDARFLFVIDQFEELFHPNNYGNPDARQMVEAVIDHFFNPHERCFVVATMRSEHLADCAAYLELPDAINKSLYLVRRLNEQELRDAIVGPAKCYLRLLQRGHEGHAAALPPDVVFDERLIQRLLNDVASLVHNADHLPLLQHVLARTWGTACERESLPPEGVPAEVRWSDLERAIAPGSDSAEGWLRGDDGINTLRTCLERWAEFAYCQHAPDERTQLDAVLRRLAYKDPNTGLYFQQRVDVDDPDLLPGFPQPREQLRRLLDRGFLHTVNYLFWDGENPDRVTLKVSHEAFIRGWERFRKLVDVEADRFDEFVAVLRKCALWSADRQTGLLLEASELTRVENAKLTPVFAAHEERRNWFRVLLQYRDGERLAKVEPEVDRFLAASRERIDAIARDKHEAAERERKAEEAKRAAIEHARETQSQREADAARNRWIVASLLGVVGVASLVAAFGMLVQAPAMQSMNKFAYARFMAEQIDTGPSPSARTAIENLGRLAEAATHVEDGNHGESIWGLNANGILNQLGFLPPVGAIKRQLYLSSSEHAVNERLRGMLTSRVWPSGTVRVEPAPDWFGSATPIGIACAGMGPQDLPGSLVWWRAGERGIFLPNLDTADKDLRLYDATLRDGACTARKLVSTFPASLNPAMLFDARVSKLAVALNDAEKGQDNVNLYSIDWATGQDGRAAVNQFKLLAVIPDAPSVGESPPRRASELVRAEIAGDGEVPAGVPNVKVVTTGRAGAGVEVSIQGKAWRLFAETALPVEIPEAGIPPLWIDLGLSHAASACSRLGEALHTEDPQDKPASARMFQDGRACFWISRVQTGTQVNVYAEPQVDSASLQGNLPTRIGYAVFDSAPAEPQLLIGMPGGDYEDWIALKQTPGRLLVAPWSTRALRKLAQEVLDVTERPDPTAK